MNNKKLKIMEIPKSAVKAFKDESKWLSFLKSASWHYKYSFLNQLLINAQNPNATAITTMDAWNKKLNRYVNRGANSILVVDDGGKQTQLKYVFDVNDTHQSKPDGNNFSLWKIEKDKTEAVRCKLIDNQPKENFKDLDLGQTLKLIVENRILEDLDLYQSDLFDEENPNLHKIQSAFIDMLIQSTRYFVLSRCDIDTEPYFDKSDFKNIGLFDNLDALDFLGVNVSDIAKPLLMELGKIVQTLNREKIIEESKGEQHGDHLSQGGGLQLSQSGIDGATDGTHREVRRTETAIPERKQTLEIRTPTDVGNINPTPVGNRPDSQESDRQDHGGLVETESGPGQSDTTNGVGGIHEQSQAISGRNRDGGTDLQLEYYDRETEDRNLPFFSSTNLINDMLRATPYLLADKFGITDFFRSHSNKHERDAYTKSIFNSNTTDLAVGYDQEVGYKAYKNGLHIYIGTYDNRTFQSFCDWGVISNHFNGMVILNELDTEAIPPPPFEGQSSMLQQNTLVHVPIPEEAIDAILKDGSGIRDGKYRIHDLFQRNETSNIKADFLKREYGQGGRSPAIFGTEVNSNCNSKGLHITRDDAKLSLSWREVSKRIENLIKSNHYFTDDETKKLTDIEFCEIVKDGVDWRINAVERQDENDDDLIQMAEYSGDEENDEIGMESNISKLHYDQKNKSDPLLGSSLNVNDVLRATPYLLATKREIEDVFRLNQDPTMRANYIKSIFNNDATELTIEDGKTIRNVGYEAYPDALIIWEREYDNTIVENDYSWGTISDHYAGMMLLNEFNEVKPSSNSDQLSMLGFSPNNELSFPKKATDTILKKGTGKNDGMFRIYCLYQRNLSPQFRAKFLENEYGSYNATSIISGTNVNMYADKKGLHIERFHTDTTQNFKTLLPWKQTEKFIGELIQGNNYFSVSEQEMLTGDFLSSINADLDERIDAILRPQKNEVRTEGFLTNEPDTTSHKAPINEYGNIDPQSKVQNVPSTDIETGNTNFHITDDKLGHGTAREKYHNNITAIKTLFEIDEESRIATPEEQSIMSKYVGWGGLSQAFDDSNVHWTSEYLELKNLLSDDDCKSARASTLSAFYTSPTIIKAMYSTLNKMGFQKGNILDPGMGVGNFFGLVPESMNQSKLYGVEIDTISGRLAKQLYPKANVFVGGFEETAFQNNFFDVAIGNVPFGSNKIQDKAYDKNNFLIHDYFFVKTLDKVRAGGVVAFITSKGTLDKKNSSVRKYLSERAELIGAVRLPNNAFAENAGTQVTSDIIFLKKREHLSLDDQDWVHLEEDNGITMNSYFVNNPNMILGEMKLISGPFGHESACIQIEGQNLGVELKKALNEIQHEFTFENIESFLVEEEEMSNTLPADPDVANFSYTLVEDKIYFRNNSIMISEEFNDTTTQRIKGMIEIRDFTREIINLQLNDFGDSAIKNSQTILNQLYDDFSDKYGLINSRTNKKAFSDDGSYCLLCSLEVLTDDGEFARKADMFSKRTIKKHQVITEVDTSNEALILSISEKATIDFDYMIGLTGKTKNEITRDLHGVIFLNPESDAWEPADEYLSGDVRSKLNIAKKLAEHNPDLDINVASLQLSQPKDLEASEIEVRLGATWIEPHYIKSFMAELLQTPRYYLIDDIDVAYSKITGTWNIKGKNADDRDNVYANVTYGTNRANGYRIIEDSLNLKDIQITDTYMDGDKKKTVINKDETILASQKQEMIKEAFRDWIFNDPERRNHLVDKYNTLFNSVRPREYDGSHVVLHGVSPEITLRPYQLNAIARSLYGGNTLLAHCVGAGKTFEMTSIAMESKYLGLAEKSMFVVPNHLIGQWGSEFLQLYPGANVLVATAKDFQPDNRKKFCSRIATGDYDAVIIGHSQFEKIPLSVAYQKNALTKQIDDLLVSIKETKRRGGENFTIKQMEKSRKSLESKMDALNNTSRKDNVVTFEELGVDRLFIDEAHNYKNLYLHTKMRNVAGIGGSQAQKSTDMFNKCQYLDEKTGGKGVIFATGTPISNSMTELYTMMRYLQYHTLENMGLTHFDAWASSFAEPVTSVELSPEGGGYRSKTRLARFYNLPELMNVFKEVADVQTPDMLSLPIPKATFIDVVSKPSEHQKELLLDLVVRAKAVRDKTVDTSVDNMLCITNDGRKLALDQRLINPLLPDHENSKTNACANNIYKVWEDTKEQKSSQLVFCDLSTPKKDGRFTVYADIKAKAIALGIPENEIAFIHDADTETKKEKLFKQVRRGEIRILMGSTAKLGAGTNVQDLLVALHHLDVPWRPSDIEQQEGRILRQGNQNENVEIFRYITEETFDAYSWQLIENKQKFIGQVMTSKSPGRSCEDVDEQALSYAEIKALATGNPYIKEKMDLDIKVMRLKLIKANHSKQQYRLEDNVAKHFPKKISMALEMEKALIADHKLYTANKPAKDDFSMTIKGKHFIDKKEAGKALLESIRIFNSPKLANEIGEYCGFKMYAQNKGFDGIELSLRNKTNHKLVLGSDEQGNLTRINNTLDNIPGKLSECKAVIDTTYEQLENAKIELTKPFSQDDELNANLLRLKELNALLSMDETINSEEKDIKNEEPEEHEWEREA